MKKYCSMRKLVASFSSQRSGRKESGSGAKTVLFALATQLLMPTIA